MELEIAAVNGVDEFHIYNVYYNITAYYFNTDTGE